MSKLRSLNIRFTRDERVALEDRAQMCGRSVSEHIRTLIDKGSEGGRTPLLDAITHEIIHTAVSTHHLVTLTGDRRDLTGLAAEARRTARLLGVHHVE